MRVTVNFRVNIYLPEIYDHLPKKTKQIIRDFLVPWLTNEIASEYAQTIVHKALNCMTKEDLMKCPGVGPKTAQIIIDAKEVGHGSS